MDSSPSANLAMSGSSPPSRTASDTGTRNPTTPNANENQTPAMLPRGFESMLKTTTETGDIGLFSIRPSRLPQSLNTPRRTGGTYMSNGQQKPLQGPFPFYGVPAAIDDRRRLPSYARDASSDLASRYETASQQSTSSRVFRGPDHRSLSMTQSTSFSAYTLTNQKSYTSLRSHAEGMIQRPRSPFVYPTRLRRPGFRPSSPALTDSGVIDYSRRAEIERPILVSQSPQHKVQEDKAYQIHSALKGLSVRKGNDLFVGITTYNSRGAASLHPHQHHFTQEGVGLLLHQSEQM
ncbi:hypothetical protein PVAG01_09212 [Phlyctema vagabunda]|uniref:Uncharacterized protein n=1 Tax=Phlyctema vagabunda TaxID=108571 RepID=A0ABR4P6Q0_9HELO